MAIDTDPKKKKKRYEYDIPFIKQTLNVLQTRNENAS